MKKLALYLLILLLALAMLPGCGGTSEVPENSGTGSEESIPDDGEAAESSGEPDLSGLGDKLAGAYFAMAEKGTYFMKSKMTVDMEGQSVAFDSSVAVSGDDMAVATAGDGMDSLIIFKDGKTYMVDHLTKTVTVMQGVDSQSQSQDLAFDTDGITFVDSGKEDGLVYEEYSSPDGSTSKYYFSGKELVKIKMSYSYGGTSEVEILEMTDKIPAGAFDLPSGYQQVEL